MVAQWMPLLWKRVAFKFWQYSSSGSAVTPIVYLRIFKFGRNNTNTYIALSLKLLLPLIIRSCGGIILVVT